MYNRSIHSYLFHRELGHHSSRKQLLIDQIFSFFTNSEGSIKLHKTTDGLHLRVLSRLSVPRLTDIFLRLHELNELRIQMNLSFDEAFEDLGSPLTFVSFMNETIDLNLLINDGLIDLRDPKGVMSLTFIIKSAAEWGNRILVENFLPLLLSGNYLSLTDLSRMTDVIDASASDDTEMFLEDDDFEEDEDDEDLDDTITFPPRDMSIQNYISDTVLAHLYTFTLS